MSKLERPSTEPVVKKDKKHRRPRGSGSVYRVNSIDPITGERRPGRIWWISYFGPDGKRHAESTESERKGDGERLLQRRVGAREHNLPVVPKAEHLTFDDAAQAVITRFEINKQLKTAKGVRRKIEGHLQPFFGGRRLVGITADDVIRYIARRQQQGIIAWKGKRKGERIKDVSNSQINRELGVLKLVFNRALKDKRIGAAPYIEMLDEPPPCKGFFEPEQMASVLRHLTPELAAVVEFGYITGWRVASEVLPLEWGRVDFKAGTVRLDAGTTKNDDARVVYMTAALRRLLEGRLADHEQMKRAGHITPLVFFRERAETRGGEKKPKPVGSFKRAWQLACRAAGVPGKKVHDLRRTAVRDLDRAGVSRTVAMKMVGHRTESMYNRYNITSDGDLKEAARKLDIAGVQQRSAQRAASKK